MKTYRAEAHGRVNLIGEHTDYNGGFVLPTAIPQKTTVEIRKRSDSHVRVISENMPLDHQKASYELGQEKPLHDWVDYVQGITWVLKKSGYDLQGFDAHIESSVPIGSGLSSSAALEISLLKALASAFNLNFEVNQMAKLGQKAENEFVGAHVGIMDQMACALASSSGEALFIDTQDLSYFPVSLPLHAVDLIVISSGISHDHSAGDYNQRRAECEEAARLLGLKQLRDLSVADLSQIQPKLTDKLFRRVRHVVTENLRVEQSVKALRSQELQELGRLLNQSHASLRDDYEVSIPAIDDLVDIAQKHPNVYGARMTGGGFGGSILALAHVGTGQQTADDILSEYKKKKREAEPVILIPNSIH